MKKETTTLKDIVSDANILVDEIETLSDSERVRLLDVLTINHTLDDARYLVAKEYNNFFNHDYKRQYRIQMALYHLEWENYDRNEGAKKGWRTPDADYVIDTSDEFKQIYDDFFEFENDIIDVEPAVHAAKEMYQFYDETVRRHNLNKEDFLKHFIEFGAGGYADLVYIGLSKFDDMYEKWSNIMEKYREKRNK